MFLVLYWWRLDYKSIYRPMKTITRIITALFSVLLFCLSAMAEEYSVLVIPDSCLVSNQKNLVESVDIEELLARKFIDKLEISGKDYAPTLRILKISIKNNPTFNKNSLKSYQHPTECQECF